MLFFELLQIALGNRDRLSVIPSAKEWQDIYIESERQAVTGILLHGIDKLPAEQRPPQVLLLQWIGIGEQIRVRNTLLNQKCVELISSMTFAGLKPTILKGQGVALYYSETLRPYRQPGDIDVFISEGREESIEYAESLRLGNVSWDYVHLHLPVYKDIEVELHYRVEISLNLFRNLKLQRWFKDNEYLLYCKNGELTTPTIEMDLFYVLLHIYRHFISEGVGFRQLVDYYFVLIAAKGIKIQYSGGQGLEKVLKEFGMWRFAKGFMWVMQEVFALDREYIYCDPSEKEGRFILKVMMEGGNFGHDKHTKIKGIGKLNTLLSLARHNMQIVRRYPSEALLSPIWYVWHKCWKLTR